MKLTNCIFTDNQILDLEEFPNAFLYQVEVHGKLFTFHIPKAELQKAGGIFFKENKHLFAGFLFNNKWFQNQSSPITEDRLKELLSNNQYPKTPQEKLDNLFLHLFELQESDGGVLQLYQPLHPDNTWKSLYFKNNDEYAFYLQTLKSEGLIGADIWSSGVLTQCRITYKGLTRAIKLQEEGNQSKNCFIAMSFRPEMELIRRAIKEAVSATGFVPILVDENYIQSDRTINDEIIANLKKCKFCIADFTGQSLGVYFESGFALGQGKQVIYTCQADDFSKNAHFDIKPLQHILYTTPEQLTKELIHKIEAWVK